MVATELAADALEVPPIGAYGRKVSGASAEAQAWFDQGLRYTYAFNQDAAAACFGRAALASPKCPMAWWGIAHVLSVDINNQEVSEQEAERALIAIGEAMRFLTQATEIEKQLILATLLRTAVPPPAPTDRKELDKAYAFSMEEAWASAPDDADVGALFAESLMLLQPWNYWTADRKPVGRAREIVSTLEEVIRLNPDHPGANHFYIHAVESSSDPARGIPSADRLGNLMPGSGHLVHMPSHIYINVGRYADAVAVNERASELDTAYFQAYKKPTFYRIYFLHNLHFAAYAAMMEGRKDLALRYVRRMEDEIPEGLLRQYAGFIDGQIGSRMHVYVRFGMWSEILAVPEYPEYRKASRALRRYARTVALANLGRTEEARAELARFDQAAAATPKEWTLLQNPSQNVYRLARQVATGEILWREGKPKESISLLRKAAELEQDLVYTEPPAWMLPVRHALGAIQLASGDALGAEATYREDLKKNKENAWSLLGLHQALETLGKQTEAAALKPRLDRAWERADIDPPASCYCGVVGNKR
ncbi:MAG: hypothetical protein HRU14_16140 [Planctomycetes bacterium]|nr:hypothetical protein [Planctomycetota bacterium]